MSNIKPQTTPLTRAYATIEQLQANLTHRDELYEAALVKIREYEDHILTLGSQLTELKRQEENCGDDRDYWFKHTKELKTQLAAVTAERDFLRRSGAVFITE